MAHINDQPGQYDTRLAPYINKASEPKIILHVHKYMKTFLHFGGHIEHNESPWQCAIREIREESGYDISQLKILQPKDSLIKLDDLVIHPSPFLHVTYHYKELDHYHSDLKYVFVTEQEPKYKPLDGESETIRSFSRQQIIDLPKNQMKEHDKNMCLYIFDELLKKWEEIDPDLFKY